MLGLSFWRVGSELCNLAIIVNLLFQWLRVRGFSFCTHFFQVHALAFGFWHSTTLLLHEIPYLQLKTSLVREQASLVLFTLMIHIRPFVSVYGYFTWNPSTFFYVNTTSVKLCFFNFVTWKVLLLAFGFFSKLCYLRNSNFPFLNSVTWKVLVSFLNFVIWKVLGFSFWLFLKFGNRDILAFGWTSFFSQLYYLRAFGFWLLFSALLFESFGLQASKFPTLLFESFWLLASFFSYVTWEVLVILLDIFVFIICEVLRFWTINCLKTKSLCASSTRSNYPWL